MARRWVLSLLNSVSFETGLKWKGNGTTLTAMRSDSDKLCRQYGLTTIKKHSGLRGIDQATQKLAEKGKSWKVALCKALDEAVLLCNTKEQFIAFMKRKGFSITRYTDRHITFQKIGETKKIRANTLAEQFGNCYTKEKLERLMGFYVPPKPLKNPPPYKAPVPFVSEFERIEKRYFEDNPPPITPDEAKNIQQRIKQSKNPFYKTKEPDLRTILERYEKKPAVAGNILYRDLVNAQGNNFRIRLSLSAVPKLYAYPFFFSARLYSDYALVTIKERDKNLFMQILEKGNETVINRHNAQYTPLADYQTLKKRAAQLGTKVEFLMIPPEQLAGLHDEKDRFVAMPTKGGKIRLAFLPQNKDFILHALYPDKHPSPTDFLFSVGRNAKVNTRLKAEAMLGGQKLLYRTLTREQVEQLADDTQGKELFAVFDKKTDGANQNGQYNIAFKADDTEKIEQALRKQKKRR